MSNALAQESSPYLRQHADNPVDWLPWSEQTLRLAREQDKPILLSIGYSACHWCHVMAHESFENEATAALMNQHFINIKVDREERPDIDRIYQLAHQLIARRAGGWPLTMFLTPQQQLPFYGGTYFPDKPKYGMLAFSDILERIAEIFTQEPDKVQQQSDLIRQALLDIEIRENQNQSGVEQSAAERFDAQLLQAHDADFGGFGAAPKFPQAAILLQAIKRASTKPKHDPVLHAIDFSLQKIALGGIQDHLGGGFYRYSVDDQWMIPHFEKMLYDNGQLLEVYAQAYRLTANPIYEDAVAGIVTWLQRDMMTPQGTFYAAQDADSEGIEGNYYRWTPASVEQVIGAAAYPAFAYRYGLDKAPNFDGYWHLHNYYTAAQVIEKFDFDASQYQATDAASRQQLLAVRCQRVPPGLDNKVLTSWNALAIRGLATAARVFLRRDYFELAHSCLRTLRVDCWHGGRLFALGSNSEKKLPAYLDDYAHLLQASLDCLQYSWNPADLKFAIQLADRLLASFADSAHGGFFFTAVEHETLIQRPKSWPDEAMPSGNAVAALGLHRLGLLIGNHDYCAAAEKALQSVADNVNQTPLPAASFVALLEAVKLPPVQVIVRAPASAMEAWHNAILTHLKPEQSAYFIPTDAADLPAEIAQKENGEIATAWLCEGFSCRPPISDLEQVLLEL